MNKLDFKMALFGGLCAVLFLVLDGIALPSIISSKLPLGLMVVLSTFCFISPPVIIFFIFDCFLKRDIKKHLRRFKR